MTDQRANALTDESRDYLIGVGPDPPISPEPDDAQDAIAAAVLEPAPVDEPEVSRLSFRTRITIALVAVAVLPLATFSLILVAWGVIGPDTTLARLVLFAIVVTVVLAVFVAYLLAADLTRPLRAFAAAVDRVSAGDLGTPIVVAGDDELARLADSHNRLAGDLERRNRELERILQAVEAGSPRRDRWLVGRAAADAQAAFGMIDARSGSSTRSAFQAMRSFRGKRDRFGPSSGQAKSRSASSSVTSRRLVAGSARTRISSSCSPARSASRSGTPSCSPASRRRTPSSSSSTPPRTTSCGASAITSRRP
jgi:methyl-accepting chemotaxis protein